MQHLQDLILQRGVKKSGKTTTGAGDLTVSKGEVYFYKNDTKALYKLTFRSNVICTGNGLLLNV